MQKKPHSLINAFYDHIGTYMLVETPLARADVCIIFGGQRADDMANHAANLYHRGFFPRIAVTGGVTTNDGRLEAHRMRDVLIQRGVPKSAILVEDKATNTGENVINTRALLERTLGKGAIKSAIAIGQIHASRRFLMTLERHWPELKKMFTTPEYHGVGRKNWHTHPTFREGVLREYAKIAPYKKMDFIREIDPAILKPAAPRALKPPKYGGGPT